MNKKERETCAKEIEKREKKCPFSSNINFRCEDCRLYQHRSEAIGKVCSINFTAMRS